MFLRRRVHLNTIERRLHIYETMPYLVTLNITELLLESDKGSTDYHSVINVADWIKMVLKRRIMILKKKCLPSLLGGNYMVIQHIFNFISIKIGIYFE